MATGTGGAVASADLDASQSGIKVLRNGGNAIDAAVAMATTLGVTEPFVAGPGGGGYFVVYLAAQHKVVTLDGREECPAACTSTMFIDPATGQPLTFETARRSGISVGVPGMPATWATAVQNWGLKSFADDLKPAINVAERGFTIDQAFQDQEKVSLADLQTFAASRKLFLTPSGDPLPVGSTLKNPDLAKTYRLLAQNGPGYFYDGPLGADVANIVQHPDVVPGVADFPIQPGFMTTADLANYDLKTQAPTHGQLPRAATSTAWRRRRPAAPPSARRSTSCPRGRCRTRTGRGPCSTTSKPRGWPSPTATPTSATPPTRTCPSRVCSTRPSQPPGPAWSRARH